MKDSNRKVHRRMAAHSRRVGVNRTMMLWVPGRHLRGRVVGAVANMHLSNLHALAVRYAPSGFMPKFDIILSARNCPFHCQTNQLGYGIVLPRLDGTTSNSYLESIYPCFRGLALCCLILRQTRLA